jgi:hypothetical protein
MDGFEYLVALVSVVAGLGLTCALSGLAKIVHLRKEIRLSGVHIAWTGSILLWLVTYWWFTFLLASVDSWTVPLFLFVLVYGAVIYFLIALLYPDKWDSGTDVFEYFVDNRRWFFGTFVGLGILDIADTWIKIRLRAEVGDGLPMIPYLILMTSWLALGVVGTITANRIFHKAFAYVWLLVFGSWVTTALFVIGS